MYVPSLALDRSIIFTSSPRLLISSHLYQLLINHPINQSVIIASHESKSSNRGKYVKPGPGPAYYDPKPVYKQKINTQNINMQWV